MTLEELLAAASPGPWTAAVLSLGDGTGQVIVSDADGNPVFFVVEQNSENAQLAARIHALAQAVVDSRKALEGLMLLKNHPHPSKAGQTIPACELCSVIGNAELALASVERLMEG